MSEPSLLPQASLPTATEPLLGPAVILRAIRKNWFVIVVALAVAIIGALGYTARQVKIYQAVATVQFDPQPLMPLGNQPGAESGPESFWSNQEYFATQH